MTDNHHHSQSNMDSTPDDNYSSDEPPSATTTATSSHLLNPELLAAIVAALQPMLAAQKSPCAAPTTPLYPSHESSELNQIPYVTGLPEWTNESPSAVVLFFQKFSGVMQQNAIDPSIWGKILFAHHPTESKYWRGIGIFSDLPWSHLVQTIIARYSTTSHPRRMVYEHLRLSVPDGYKQCTYANWWGNYCDLIRSLDAQTMINLCGVAQLPPRIRETFLTKHELETFTTRDFQMV